MPKVATTPDPRVFAAGLKARGPRAVVVGLDLGTTTGVTVALHHPGGPAEPVDFTCGQWNLAAGPYDSGAIRFVRLRHFLAAVAPDAVFYEFVRHTPAAAVTRYNAAALLARAVTAAQLFGAFQAHVCAWCEEAGVPCASFSIQEIKKRATGRGNANKDDVIRAANARFGLDLDAAGYETTGADNVADAAFVALLGIEHYGAGVRVLSHATALPGGDGTAVGGGLLPGA